MNFNTLKPPKETKPKKKHSNLIKAGPGTKMNGSMNYTKT